MGRSGFKTRGDALDALGKAKTDYAASKSATPEPERKETLADWVRVWLRDYVPQRCTQKTIERYWQLASYVLDAKEGEPAALAATPLDALTPAGVEGTLYALLRMETNA